MNPQYLPASLNFLAPSVGFDLIRLGSTHDGGYVVDRKSILEADALISLGISTDWSFDQAFLKLNPGIPVHGYDHTVSEKFFKRGFRKSVKRFLSLRSNFGEVMECFHLLKNYQDFFQGKNRHFQQRVHNRHDLDCDATFQEIIDRIDGKNIFLKIDIEGSEYRIIDEVLKNTSKINAIAIEFHDTEPLRLVFCNAVQKLLNEFEIIHIHGNNCSPVGVDGLPEALEITFVRKNAAITNEKKQVELPLAGLDTPNNVSREDYPLRFDL
jgi:hypothetical protein